MEYENFKDWYSSKTVWAGVIAIITSIGLCATGEITFAEMFLGASGILSVVLRFFTGKPIA